MSRNRRVPVVLCVLFLVAGCGLLGPQTSPASFDRNAEQRTAWDRLNVDSYHTVVEVERFRERRRADVVVRDDVLQSATMRYWSDADDAWEPAVALNEEQGRPYTVPGLFEMVGRQLGAQQRSVKVHYDDEYAFPDLLQLGNVHDEQGTVVPNSNVEVRLITFEPLE